MSTEKKLVAHVGGTFIYSKNPKELADWYKSRLGINYDHYEGHGVYYCAMPYKDVDNDQKSYIVWSIMDSANRPTVEGKVFCINYRVHNLADTLEHLKSLGETLEKEPETYEQGKFAWIYDPDGNYIELWEDTNLGKDMPE